VYYGDRVVEGGDTLYFLRKIRREKTVPDIDADSGRPFIETNHPASGDVIRNPAHVAVYGTAFEGTISLRIRDDDGTVIAEGSTQGGSNGVIGEFKAGLAFQRRPNQRLGVVEPSRRAPAAPARTSTCSGSRSSSANGG